MSSTNPRLSPVAENEEVYKALVGGSGRRGGVMKSSKFRAMVVGVLCLTLAAIGATLYFVLDKHSNRGTPQPRRPVCFFSFGDWGKASPNVMNMTKRMAEALDDPAKYGCEAIKMGVNVGDNFYFHGVESIHDPQWQSAWVNQFRDVSPKMKEFPFYSMMGNHDYDEPRYLNVSQPPFYNLSKAQAQIDYYRQVDKNWIMPDANFTFSAAIPSAQGGGVVRFVVANSEAIWADLHLPKAYWFQANHTAWVEKQLAIASEDPNVRALILTQHRCVGGPRSTAMFDAKMEAAIIPLARKYRVSMVLTGHSHFVSYARETDLSGGSHESGELAYIISGAAKAVSSSNCTWDESVPMPVAKLADRFCLTTEQNADGAFIIHRIDAANSRFENCVVSSVTGEVIRCIPSSFRG